MVDEDNMFQARPLLLVGADWAVRDRDAVWAWNARQPKGRRERAPSSRVPLHQPINARHHMRGVVVDAKDEIYEPLQRLSPSIENAKTAD